VGDGVKCRVTEALRLCGMEAAKERMKMSDVYLVHIQLCRPQDE
jgi:hypothetical protein